MKMRIRVSENERALLYQRRVDLEDASVPAITAMAKTSDGHILSTHETRSDPAFKVFHSHITHLYTLPYTVVPSLSISIADVILLKYQLPPPKSIAPAAPAVNKRREKKVTK